MLKRVYKFDQGKRDVTYEGCSVCPEWLFFSNFHNWMINQETSGLCLVKDLINPTTKVYSPENCCFITNKVNNMIRPSYRKDSVLPTGITVQKWSGRFMARCNIGGVRGVFRDL